MLTPFARKAVLGAALAAAAAAAPAGAQAPEQTFQEANRAYDERRFADAVELYRDLLRHSIEDPVLEYNLANAEFRLGHLGRAILHFERARRLAPTDRDVLANLEFAHGLTRDRVEAARQPGLLLVATTLQDRVGPDVQVVVLLVLEWAFVALCAACFVRPGAFTAVRGWGLALLLAATAVALASWWTTLHRLEGRALAVIQLPVVEVLAGPGGNNPTLFTVHEGLTVDVRSQRSEWVQVSLPNGLNGWVARNALELV